MKKKTFLAGMLALALVFGMMLVGCDNPTNESSNPFVGTWVGNMQVDGETATMTLVLRADKTFIWTDTVPHEKVPFNGTYNLNSLPQIIPTADRAPKSG
jgi:hypothetical protein